MNAARSEQIIEVNAVIRLSPLRSSDKPALIRFLNDQDIYNNTLRIPFPYREADADELSASTPKSSAVGNVAQRPAQHMHQFVRDLMRPLWADGHLALQFDQRGVLYSAIEVRPPERAVTDFEAELTECLSQLAQVQPPTHPGEGELRHARLLKINNRHLSAISLSGAAHASILPSAARPGATGLSKQCSALSN
jgi:hypothetical protein